MIDLRSDTVTQPTDEMRAAMARAEVGDDVYLEDPTVNALQEEAAARLGKEAALFVPSGTMGNLLAVKCHTQPGDEVLIERSGHLVQFEMGGMAWFSGCLPRVLDGRRGLLDPAEVRANVFSQVPYYRARTGVVCVENTHNCGGGSVYPLATLAEIHAIAREHGVPVHMDGARLFNAAAAQGVSAAEIARHADSVMFCLSKGLSAPVGSMLCGTRELVEQARRLRRVVGGGMRQAGVLAAAGLVALRSMTERLAEDHQHARRLAEGLAEVPGIEIDPASVETNIVMLRVAGGAPACASLLSGLRERGVLVSQLSADSLRLVTHRHIGYNEVASALAAFRACCHS
ncbi:MAG: threonine aldolase family protein [Armatimonadota bacterium]